MQGIYKKLKNIQVVYKTHRMHIRHSVSCIKSDFCFSTCSSREVIKDWLALNSSIFSVERVILCLNFLLYVIVCSHRDKI